MLIHDVIAEFLLTQGDTEVRDYDIGKCITTLTHQIDGEPTPLDIQYSVRFHVLKHDTLFFAYYCLLLVLSLNFGLNLHLQPYFMYPSNKGSGLSPYKGWFA